MFDSANESALGSIVPQTKEGADQVPLEISSLSAQDAPLAAHNTQPPVPPPASPTSEFVYV